MLSFDADTEDEFRALLNSPEYDFRFDCGVSKASASISYSSVISCLHYSVSSTPVTTSRSDIQEVYFTDGNIP